MKKCPKCSRSQNLKLAKIGTSKFLICNDCGYDESEHILEVYPEERFSKGGKGSPYKKGGYQRTIKKKLKKEFNF